MHFLILFLFASACAGCHNDACADVAVPGMYAVVTLDGKGPSCDATINITNASTGYLETLSRAQAPECEYAGLTGQRAGTYSITVAHPGYRSVTRDVVFAANDCDAIAPQKLTFTLEPQ